MGIDSGNYLRRWVQCTGCGLYYSQYSRPENALDAIYSDLYRNKGSAWRAGGPEEVFNAVTALPPDESETACRVAWIKSELQGAWNSGFMTKGTPPFKCLDIGGAPGVFAHGFKDKDWRPSVIDPSSGCSFLPRKHGIPYIKDYYKPGLLNETFDLVSMVFLLEHLIEPHLILNSIKPVLTERSCVYVEVPDAYCFQVKPHEDDIFNACHLWMFSPETLMLLMEQCGIQMLSMKRTRTHRGHYSIMFIGSLK